MGKNDINRAALWWAGPLTVVVAVLLVFATRAAAVPLLGLDAEFPPLTYGGLAFFTVILVSLGVLVFVGFVLWSARPIATYRKVALVALVLSMFPDAWLPRQRTRRHLADRHRPDAHARGRVAADRVHPDQSDVDPEAGVNAAGRLSAFSAGSRSTW